jgi:hypothetical protein
MRSRVFCPIDIDSCTFGATLVSRMGLHQRNLLLAAVGSEISVCAELHLHV